MAHHSKVWPVAPTDGVDSLTAAEAVALDNGQYSAIDGDAGGTWAPAAVVEIGGAGLQVDKLLEYARSISADYTLDASGPDVAILASASGAGNVTVTLTAAVANRIVKIKKVAGSHSIVIAPNGTDTIEGLNASYLLTQIGSEITLVGISGGWSIIGRGHNLASQSWTASGTTLSAWTAPAGCYFVDVELCGGGGGGAGGGNGTTATSQAASGGPGGGGAPRVRRRVAVTPGQACDVTVGAGGTGGPAATAGTGGGHSAFTVHGGADLVYGNGGGGGNTPCAVTASVVFVPGGTISGAANTGQSTYSSTELTAPQSAGGYGNNAVSATASTAGSWSDSSSGGAAASSGTNAGTSWGGGGGAGGGGGPYGVGAAGGAGGNGNSGGAASNGSNGSSASANTGAGGGGAGAGGQGTSGSTTGGTGGTGGSGKVTIWWVE